MPVFSFACMDDVVGAEGFELSTSSSQSWRSTRLSYAPNIPHVDQPVRGVHGKSLPRSSQTRIMDAPRQATARMALADDVS